MKNKIFEINVDFETKSAVDTDLIKIVKGDYNSIEFDLKMDKIDYKRAVLFLVKPSKKNFVVDIANSKAIFTEKNTFDEVGIYYYGIVLYGTNSKLTTSTKGKIQVVEGYNEDNEDITGDDNYPILDKLIEEVTDLKDKINASLGVMNKTFKEVTYDPSTGVMSFKNLNNEVTNINLPLSLLISSASYDNDNKKIVLTLANNDTIDIPILDLVSNYYDDKINANKEYIASTSNELYRLKTDVLETGESSGNNIHLEDSAWSEMQEVSIDGVCEQKTTTGKNLLDYVSNLKTSTNGLTNVINEDGSITTSGKPTLNYIPIVNNTITDILEDGETYTISRGNASNKIYVQIVAKKVDGTYAYINSINGSSSFTVNKTIYTNYSIKIQTNTIDGWGDSSLTITNKYMLCKGTDTADTSFEPYTGNQPSPSPNFPQNISVLTGNLKLTSCDNGLFDGELRQGSWSSINDSTRCFNKNNIYVEPGDYLLITDLDINNYRYGILVSNDIFPIQVENFSYNSGWKQANKFEFSLTKSGNLGINISSINNASINPSIFTNVKWLLIKLDLASVINITIPSNEFVGKIDDTYKDTLNVVYKSDGHYHLILNKMVGKIVLDGSEDEIWTAQLTNASGKSRLRLDASKFNMKTVSKINEIGKIISTCFLPVSVERTWFNYNGIAVDISKYIFIYSEETSNLSLTDFKNRLSTHNVEAYYALETPYELDLGIVDTLLSYDEITNIFTDSDLLPIINVKYYRNFITTIQNLQINNDILKNELVSIESRLTALENANTSAVDNNPTAESEVTE